MSEMNNIYFVTGGGTGGHIYPALAVAEELSREAKVYYVGNKRNMEYSLAIERGYKFLHVSIKGMPRKLSPKFFIWVLKLLRAIILSVRYIKKYKPNAVFATGGYVSAPMIFACVYTKTPYIMHDCDAMPGLVSRRLSQWANNVTLAFEKARKYIPNKNTVVTVNPIRKEFSYITQSEARANMELADKLTLCVMGGSQGAKSINGTIIDLIRELSQEKDLQIIFQTGEKNYSDVTNQLSLVYPEWENDKNLIIKPYFNDMISVLKSSDIVVSRAGSLSLSEICASECAPIIVPYPYAAANHQRINAKTVQSQGACIYIEDSDLDPNILRKTLFTLIENPLKISYLKQNSSNLAKYNATKKIVELIKGV